jgi:hypothetical protein
VGPLAGGDGWAAAAREAQGRLRAAATAAGSERRRREEELWDRLEHDRRPADRRRARTLAAGGHRRGHR